MLRQILAWKYAVAVAVILGCSVYVTRKDQETRDQYEQKCTQLNNRLISPWLSPNEDCDKGAENAARHLPRRYRVFSWPEGITAWAILLTLFAIAEQTGQTREAARATRKSAEATREAAVAAGLSAQALVNAERARIGFSVTEMGRSFQLDGKNCGKTSARIVYARGFTVVITPDEALPSIPVYVGAPNDSSEWIGPNELFDIPTTNDRYPFLVDLSDISLCERIRDKKAVLWAFGCIRYFDGVSSDQREKRFCFATSVDEASGRKLETYMYPAGPEIYRIDT